MNGFMEAVVLDNLDCQQWILIHPSVLMLTIFQLGFGYGSDSSAFFSVPIDAADRAHGLFDVELLL